MPTNTHRFVRRLSRRTVLSLALAAGLAISAVSGVSFAQDAGQTPSRFPEPSLYPVSWELKFTHSAPKRIAVQAHGDATPKAYWYMTYTATNLGDEEVEFDPVFEMLADDGKLYRANRAIPTEVFEAIKKKEGNRLLQSPRNIYGNIKPGEEQSKDGVAIWREPAGRMGTFSIFASGLSGETVTLKKVGSNWVPINPKNAAEELKDVKDEDRMVLRKQYMATYKVLGDDVRPGIDPIQKVTSRWVMR